MNNTRWQQLVALLSVLVPEGFKLNVGSSAPAPADRIYPWFRLESDGKPDRLYHYTSGYWLSMHQIPADSPIRLAYTDDSTSLETYDGGENAPVSDIAGPFWEIDPDFAGRIPAGVGNLPSFATSGNTIALNTDYGADQYTLLSENLKNHRHFTFAAQTPTDNPGPDATNQAAYFGTNTGANNYNYQIQGVATGATVARTSLADGLSGANAAFDILSPVRGVNWIMRTARQFYRQNA